MKPIKFLTLFLLITLFGSMSYSSDKNDNDLQIIRYRVKKWENVRSIADKFKITEYTIRTSNNIFFGKVYPGKIILIPNKNVTIFKIPSWTWNVRRIAFKFYVKDKNVIIFNYNFQQVKIENEHQKLPRGYYATVPQLQEKSFEWPTQGPRKILSGWGERINPTKRHRRRLWEFHTGIDIPIPRRHNILAAKSGRILYSGWLYGYGLTVIIEHTNGDKTLYAHLKKVSVRRGAYVHQKMLIAWSGSTGRSTGPHLHFEIRIDDKPVNPRDFYSTGKINKMLAVQYEY
jgi:murein DD-endopeptidase MepM/ murein hydrolase activator NlpD